MKPKAVILSSPNILSVSLTRALISKNIFVYLLAEKTTEWDKEISDIKINLTIEKNNFEIISLENIDKLIFKIDYFFIIIGFDLPKNNKDNLSEIKIYLDKLSGIMLNKNIKSALLIPYVFNFPYLQKVENLFFEYFKKEKNNFKIFYLSQLFGPRMTLIDEDIVSSLIKDTVDGRESRLPIQNITIYPLYVEIIVIELLHNFFSYGFSGEKVALVRSSAILDFFEILQKLNPSLRSVKDPSIQKLETASVSNLLELKSKKNEDENYEGLKKTVNWFKVTSSNLKIKNLISINNDPKEINTKSSTKFNKRKKFVFIISLCLLFLVLSPFMAILTSLLTFQLAYKSSIEGNLSRGEVLFSASYHTAVFSKRELISITSIPLVGRKLTIISNIAALLEKAALIGKKSVSLSDKAIVLVSSVFGDKEFENESIANDIYLELDTLYKETSFLQSEIDNLPGFGKKLLKNKDNLFLIRKYIANARDIARQLPNLLGSDKPKTYLVLFQNNMELRPTGGFIGSFALITFDKGRLIDKSVHDVYSADGQLKGFVKPPKAIKDYLGETNWYLRDSNWDPDFPTSAQRAEWFLEKEIDRNVDGVVAIDLEVAKSILKETGPVNLKDIGQLVDTKNVYEKVQYEVENNFFPGSQKKATILTSLTAEMLMRIIERDKKDYLKIAKVLFDNLSTRHIQIYLNNSKIQKSISDLEWNGSVNVPNCKGNCFNNWMGVVEANVGVNKANYFIRRTNSLVTKINEDSIENVLDINLSNTAESQKVTDRYKVYIRVLAPTGSFFGKIVIKQNEEYLAEINEIGDRVEAGILIEVAPSETQNIRFVWKIPSKLDFTISGDYFLTVRKQAGIIENPILIRFEFPKNLELQENPTFNLTSEDTVGYNTDLERDFISQIKW